MRWTTLCVLLVVAILPAAVAPASAQEPTLRTTLYGHKASVRAGFFSPDGKLLVSSAETTLLWDLAAGKSTPIAEGMAAPLHFSPDGKLLLLSRDARKEIQIYDIASDKNSVLSIVAGLEQYTVMSPDGQSYVVWDAKHNLVLRQLATPYDVTTGRNEVALEGVSLRWNLFHMQFSADSKTLVTKNHDGDMMLWDVGSGKSITIPEARGNDLALSPDSKTLVADCGANTQVSELATGKSIASIAASTTNTRSSKVELIKNPMVYSPDSKTIAAASVTAVLLWDATTGKSITTLKKSKIIPNEVLTLRFSPDSKMLAVGTTGQAFEVWDMARGKIIASLPNEGANFFLTISPDGTTWTTGGRDGRIRVWDMPGGKPADKK